MNNVLREEYLQRINRVMDYIELNLDRELKLEQLAEIANFSPFHFHRIFRSFVREPLYKFIMRLRIEKAALLLISNPKKTVTEIAFDCGFSASATFARAFKEFFGQSASEWKNGGYKLYSKNRKTDSKICKTDSKISKVNELQPLYFRTPNYFDVYKEQWRNAMSENKISTDVKVEILPAMNLIYVRNIGPYKGDEKLFESLFGKLFSWAGPRGLINPPQSMFLSIYHDNPEITEDEKLRLSVCMTVPDKIDTDGEVGYLQTESGKYAVGRFEISPDQYQHAWDFMFGNWLPQSGYQPDDRPCMEIYRNDPHSHPEGKHLVDVCIPVKPL